MRQSHDRAIAAGCTAQELNVLAALHYWLASFSRLRDRRSLGQVAEKAGIWREDGPCPPWARQKASQRLQALVACGAIEFTPARGPGAASWFALPPAVERQPTDECLSGESQPASGESQPAGATKRNPRGLEKQPGEGRPYEKTSEQERGRSSREQVGAPSVDGPPARPVGPAAADAWIREEVERAMTERATVPPDAAAIRIEEEHVRSRLFAAIVADDDDDLDVAREAMKIGDHLGRHLRPDVLEVIVAELHNDPPARPALALRTARTVAERFHCDLPRLDLSIGRPHG